MARLEVPRRAPRARGRRQGPVHVRGAELVGVARIRRPRLVTKAFALDSDTGVMLWGRFGDACDCPKRFLYKVSVRRERASPTRRAPCSTPTRSARTRTSSSSRAWPSGTSPAATGRSTRWTTAPARSAAGSTRASVSAAYYENDHDASPKGLGMRARLEGPLDRYRR